jgi:hypothetical protein
MTHSHIACGVQYGPLALTPIRSRRSLVRVVFGVSPWRTARSFVPTRCARVLELLCDVHARTIPGRRPVRLSYCNHRRHSPAKDLCRLIRSRSVSRARDSMSYGHRQRQTLRCARSAHYNPRSGRLLFIRRSRYRRPASNSIIYAVVSCRAFLGISKKYRPQPWSSLTYS